MCIALQTYELLDDYEKLTLQELINKICETLDPDDFNNDTTPLKIEMHVSKMYMNDLLDFNERYYELTPEFVRIVESAKEGA